MAHAPEAEPASTSGLPNYYDHGLRFEAPSEFARRTVPPGQVPGTNTEEMAYWIARVIDRAGGEIPPRDELAEMAEDAMRFGWVEVQRHVLADRIERARRTRDPRLHGY